MAITFTKYPSPDQFVRLGRGDVVEVYGEVTFDASYPNTGGTVGEPIAASDFGLDSVLFVTVGDPSVVTKKARWDRAAAVIHIDVQDAISGIYAEAANASDQSLVIVPVRIVGRLKTA